MKNILIKVTMFTILLIVLLSIIFSIRVPSIQEKFETTCFSMVNMYMVYRFEYDELYTLEDPEYITDLNVLKFQFNKISICYRTYMEDMLKRYPNLDTTKIIEELPYVK